MLSSPPNKSCRGWKGGMSNSLVKLQSYFLVDSRPQAKFPNPRTTLSRRKITGKVYLHQQMGLGRAEQNCTLCCLYSTLQCTNAPLFLLQCTTTWRQPGLSRGCVDFFVISHRQLHTQTFMLNRLRLLKRRTWEREKMPLIVVIMFCLQRPRAAHSLCLDQHFVWSPIKLHRVGAQTNYSQLVWRLSWAVTKISDWLSQNICCPVYKIQGLYLFVTFHTHYTEE